MDEWLSQSDLFRGSVVLTEARGCLEPLVADNKDTKQKLIDFLQLEKKAHKWYGTSVPWCYLYSIACSWKNLSSDELIKGMEREAEALGNAMYSLAGQQGGVPRVFMEARCQAEQKGLPVSPEKDHAPADLDDDDVIVVKEVPAFQAQSRSDSYSGNGKTAEPEVIEIL